MWRAQTSLWDLSVPSRTDVDHAVVQVPSDADAPSNLNHSRALLAGN